jgi:hypothetical protein
MRWVLNQPELGTVFGLQSDVKKRRHERFEQSTVASAGNRDAAGRPLPKPPRVPELARPSAPRLAWNRMLAQSRRRASVVSISSVLRFRRLALAKPAATALREPVRQFRGLGLALKIAGLLAWVALSWAYALSGAAAGAVVAATCYWVGRARSKPWRCGNCKAPLATAKVRVCPGCAARLVDPAATKVIPRAR